MGTKKIKLNQTIDQSGEVSRRPMWCLVCVHQLDDVACTCEEFLLETCQLQANMHTGRFKAGLHFFFFSFDSSLGSSHYLFSCEMARRDPLTQENCTRRQRISARHFATKEILKK